MSHTLSNRMRILGIILVQSVILFFFDGCLPTEQPVAPYPRGDNQSNSVRMGADYRTQIFFNLDQNRVVDTTNILAWDIAFESAAEGYHILLNPAKYSGALCLGSAAWDTLINNAADFSYVYDGSDGNLDSTAIGTWWKPSTSGNVQGKGGLYLVNLGANEKGRALGYRKLMIHSCSDGVYDVEVSDLNGSNRQRMSIKKDTARPFVYYTLANGGAVVPNAEPEPDTWDIVFTKYVYIFWDPEYYPYSVTGVLLNRNRTESAVDSVKPYASITSNDIPSYSFSAKRDGIGYNWKSFDLVTGLFTVNTRISYIIRDSKGFYYKLHFQDFYNEHGEKGTPKFEFQKL